MELHRPLTDQAPVFSNEFTYKRFVLGLGNPVDNLPILSQIGSGEFGDMRVMPKKYGKAFPSRQGFFDVFDLEDLNGERKFVIGFGRAKPYDNLDPQTEGFFEHSQKEQAIIEDSFSDAAFSFIPRQWLAYGAGLRGFDTTVFIRDRFKIVKTLPKILPQDFDIYPVLGDQFRAFRSVIGAMRTRKGCMIDIANPRNLGIDPDGHLKFFDLNYLISNTKKDNSGALNINRYSAVMNLWIMAHMSDGMSYKEAKRVLTCAFQCPNNFRIFFES